MIQNPQQNQQFKTQMPIKQNEQQKVEVLKQFSMVKQPQQNIKHQGLQQLQVEIVPKIPQEQSKGISVPIDTQIQILDTPYGPFSQIKQKQEIQLKQVNSSINYDIDISPILSQSVKQQNPIKLSKNQQKKVKNSSNVLTQQSVHEISQKIDSSQLQRQILNLAKNIRQKVSKKQTIKRRVSMMADMSPSQIVKKLKNIQNKQTDLKLKETYQKRHSLFQKYSYPRSVGINIKDIQKKQEILKLGKYKTSRVYRQDEFQQSIQNTEEQAKSIEKQKSLSFVAQDLNKKGKQSVLPKLKLSFDSTHHRYRITEFRKSILKQKKERQFAKQLEVKQKEQTLSKRRQLYNHSRYHPVGIKLSALRLSKLQKSSTKQINFNNLITNENKSILSREINNQNQINSGNNLQRQSRQLHQLQKTKVYVDLKNESEAKSSLTFNFSFSDQKNTDIQLKSQSQIYRQMDNLTKQLQNDSTPLFKQNQNVQMFKNNQVQVKKWQPIEKQMIQSKHIQSFSGLHNSSDQQDSQQNIPQENSKNTSLQYSHF